MKQVEIKNLIKKFENKIIIDDFSLDIDNGEFITLLGPSGCGKTTLLRILAGFEKSDTGSIKLSGRIVDENNIFEKPQTRDISMVFQSYALWPSMNVYENIAYPLKIKKFARFAIEEKVNKMMDVVGILDIKNNSINEISGGQQQRVALARALICSPKLILMDEPLSNLDTKLKESLRYEIKSITKQFNISVIFVTHDKVDAMLMSDRVVIMNEGKLVQVDTPYNIYKKPKNEFVARFVGDCNILSAKYIENRYKIEELNVEIDKDYIGDEIKLAINPFDIILNRAEESNAYIKNIYYVGSYCDIEVAVYDKILKVRVDANLYEEYKGITNVKVEVKSFICLGEK